MRKTLTIIALILSIVLTGCTSNGTAVVYSYPYSTGYYTTYPYYPYPYYGTTYYSFPGYRAYSYPASYVVETYTW